MAVNLNYMTNEERSSFSSMFENLNALYDKETGLEQSIARLGKQIKEEDDLMLYYNSMSPDPMISFSAGPGTEHLRRSIEYGKERDRLRALLVETTKEKDDLVWSIVEYYAGVMHLTNYELPLEDLVMLGELAKRNESKENALYLFTLAKEKAQTPAEITDIKISLYELSGEGDIKEYKKEASELLQAGDLSAGELLARASFVHHRITALKGIEEDEMVTVDFNTSHLFESRLQDLKKGNSISPKETIYWLKALVSRVRYLLSKYGEADDEEKERIISDIEYIQVKAIELAFPYLGYDDFLSRFRALEDDFSKTVYEELALLQAEASFFTELTRELPANAIARYREEALYRFPDSKSLIDFENGICKQFDGLCKQTYAHSTDSAFRTAMAHLDDNSFGEEMGFFVGGGVAGAGLGMGTCALIGLLGGPIGEGISLATCGAIGFAGGSLAGYGGSKAYSLYHARDKIEQSYETGFSGMSTAQALLRMQMVGLEAGSIMLLGGLGVASSTGSIGLRTLTQPIKGAIGPVLTRAGSMLTTYAPPFVRNFASSASTVWTKSTHWLGVNYLKAIHSKPILIASSGLVAYDVATDNLDRWPWENNYDFDGLTHWYGYFPATLVVGNAIFPKLIGVSETGNAVGSLLGTGFQVYFQNDAGRDPEYFDWNRSLAGYGFMLASTFTGRTVLDGTKYWQQSVVGRAHLQFFNALDSNVLVPVFGKGLVDRSFGRALTYGVMPGTISNNIRGWNGVNPLLSIRGRVKLSFYNSFLMGGFNIATAWAQGIDVDRSTGTRLAKMWIWNMLFGPLQAKYGFDKPAGFLVGKPTGEALTWGLNLVSNMFGRQSLHELPLSMAIDDNSIHAIDATDEEKRNEILDMVRRGTMSRSIAHPFDRQLMPETVERFVVFLSNLGEEDKERFSNLLGHWASDAINGSLSEDQTRTVEMMAIAMLIDLRPPESHRVRVGSRKVDVVIPTEVNYDLLAYELNIGTYDDLFTLAPDHPFEIPSIEIHPTE